VITDAEPNFQLGPNALGHLATSSRRRRCTIEPVCLDHGDCRTDHGQSLGPVPFDGVELLPIGEAATAIRQATKELDLPPSIGTSFRGQRASASAGKFQLALSIGGIIGKDDRWLLATAGRLLGIRHCARLSGDVLINQPKLPNMVCSFQVGENPEVTVSPRIFEQGAILVRRIAIRLAGEDAGRINLPEPLNANMS
jgi:hypothetical protein